MFDCVVCWLQGADGKIRKAAVLSTETRAAPTLTFQLKIMIGFLQIGASCSVFDPWRPGPIPA